MRFLMRCLSCLLCTLVLGGAALGGLPQRALADDALATGFVNANRLNLRKGPGTDTAVVTVLDRGDAVEVRAVSGSWLQVKLTATGKTGYALAQYITLDPFVFAALGLGHTTGNVHFRQKAAASSKSLGVLRKGRAVILLARAPDSWYQVRLPETGAEGYVSSRYLTLVCKTAGDGAAAAGTPGSVNGSRVNFRSGPSTSDASLGKLDRGAALLVLSQRGSWYRVKLASSGKTGYIYRLYVTLDSIPDETQPAALGTVNGNGVNLRRGPSTAEASLGKLNRNTAVTVLALSGSWYRVRVNKTGQTGYIFQRYVTPAD